MKVQGSISRLAAAVMVLSWAGAATAASPNPVFSGSTVDMYLKFFPSALDEEKVYLDAGTGSTITGHVGSQTGTTLVIFSSTTDTLSAANGFAQITAQDGKLNEITITAPGYWFEDLMFSVALTKDNTDLSVIAKDKSGATDTFAGWASANGWGPGQNDILALSHAGNLMQSVTITSHVGFDSLGGLTSLKHTQISGVTPVPEPETYAMLLAGLGLVGFAARRRLA